MSAPGRPHGRHSIVIRLSGPSQQSKFRPPNEKFAAIGAVQPGPAVIWTEKTHVIEPVVGSTIPNWNSGFTILAAAPSRTRPSDRHMFEPTSKPAPTSMFGRSAGQPPCIVLSNRRLLSLNLGHCPEGSLKIERSTAIRPGPAAVAGSMTVKERSDDLWTSTRASLMDTCRLSRRSTPGSSARVDVSACGPASAKEKLIRPLSPIKQHPVSSGQSHPSASRSEPVRAD